MAGFILTSDPRNQYQNPVIVGDSNFIQQDPYGMVNPTLFGMVDPMPYGIVNQTPFGMVDSTPFGMVESTPFGMVIPTPCVEMVAHPHPYNVMPTSFDPSLILENAYPRVPAVQNNHTVHSDTSPYLEDFRDNTELVHRRNRASVEVDYTRPKPVQKDTYKVNDCKKYLENIGKEIVSDSKKEFTNFFKHFDSYELKKKRDLEDEQREKERKERKEREERKERVKRKEKENKALEEISLHAFYKKYSSIHLFKALQYTPIPGETSQAILYAVNQSWCISDTKVTLIFYGKEQPKRETRISTIGDHCS
ncbi:uncharacterized protein [Mytilus edulis]|uniref:uncharacterized protein n=1 Tax=Mytilus edulis TaxID=6550 RepID=UPI0039EEC3DB